MALSLSCRSGTSGRVSNALFVFFLLAAMVSLPLTAHAKSNPKYASIVIDADTGMVLSESNADKRLHPASLAKVMTLLLVFDELESGGLRLRDSVPISSHAARMIPSKLDLGAGSSIRVEDAIYAVVTKSANDIAVALAEKVGGTESHFAVMMTRRARAIGMLNTTFRNASGLHDSRQVTTARDMAALARYMIYRYPRYYQYFSTRQFTYKGNTYHNHNRLMSSYPGMDGLKTGYIVPSGFNLVASAQRGGRRLIGVVFGGISTNSRNAHMKSLLDKGFDRMDEVLVASAVIPVPSHKPAVLTQVALNGISTAAGDDIGNLIVDSAFGNMIGEGDYDPASSKRLETGLMAISAHRGGNAVKSSSVKDPGGAWAVQIGAFASRTRTDQALREALDALPPALSDGVTSIAPLKTRDGWVFRGRLGGYTRKEALRACSYLKDCLAVSPRAN